jgi:hypothetical protein
VWATANPFLAGGARGGIHNVFFVPLCGTHEQRKRLDHRSD